MIWLDTALALGLGVVVGGLGGMFGVGGGILAIPALGALFTMDQQMAQGTALIMILPNAIFGFWRYYRRNPIDLRMAGALSISAVSATYFAAHAANHLPGATLRLAYACFLAALAIWLGFKATRKEQTPQNHRVKRPWPWAMLVGLVGGVFSGLFGVGGAMIAPTALTELFGLSQTSAQGLALALITPGAAVALGVYAQAHEVDWNLGIPLAIGGLAAVSLGVAGAHRLKEQRLRLLFCGFLIFTAAMLSLRV